MRGRDFIRGIAGSTTAWLLAAGAQQDDRVRRIDFLSPIAEKDPFAVEGQ